MRRRDDGEVEQRRGNMKRRRHERDRCEDVRRRRCGARSRREETAMRARLPSHWGRAATGAPLHEPARLLGRRRVDLPGRGRVRASWPPWQGFRQMKLEASGYK